MIGGIFTNPNSIMPTPRIFQNQPLLEGTILELDESGSHHIGTVLRMAVGEPVVLFNGTGGEYYGTVNAIDKKSVRVSLDFFNDTDRTPPLHIHLGQVMGKGDRMDYALQKAVELGVSEITPLTSHHCEVSLKGDRLTKKMQQWRHLLISACEQSGLNIIPTLNPPLPVHQWVGSVQAERKWILHTDNEPANPFQGAAPASVCFAVGPEGGFADEEVALAREQGFAVVTLGPRVWRTETAPVVMLSLIQMAWGDFN